MDILCTADLCPVILNSTCVFYEGNNLTYTGINTNDSIQTALQKIDAKFGNAMVGYIFTNGVSQSVPGAPVGLGGSLTANTSIGGNFTLTFTGNLQAARHITTGGTASQFVKGDGTLDSTSYQVAGNYITALTGDIVATGPGSVSATLATVNSNPGTYGTGSLIPVVTVDTKGRVTALTTTAINVPSGILSFVGDVFGSGATGSTTTLTLNNVNSNVYNSNTFLKFTVNPKGLVTGATPVTDLDIQSALGYIPVPNTRTITINGITQTLQANRSWTLPGGGSVTNVSATAGTGISVSVTDPATTPNITITNTAPDQVVSIDSGSGIDVTGSYPNFTVAATNAGTVTSVTASAPLASSGGATPNITISQAGTAADGFLSFTDWNTFNSKQPAGNYVTTARAINTTGPLQGGGNLTSDRTLSITQSGTSTDGYLSSTDWNTFNNKQTAGHYITDLTGEATATGPGNATVTLSTPAVTGKLLTGVNITGGTVVGTDTILQGIGKLQNQINGLIGGSTYEGTWDATTNTPTLVSSVGVDGHYYIVSVAGNTNLNGITNWHVGDWAIFHAGVWQKVDNTDAVISVNGYTGAVNLVSSDIPEGATNLYFTNTRARQALSLTTSGTSGVATYNDATGIFNIPNYTTDLSGYVPTTRTLTINGTAYNLSADRSWSVGTVTSVAALTIGTTGTDLSSSVATGTTTPVITLNVPTASATNRGALSSSDWTTFNSKQSALGYTPVPETRTLTINGETYDLSANRSWTIAGGVTSFNTRTGAITLTSTDVTNALGYTPVTNARTLTINGETYDLTANRSWTVSGGISGTGTTDYVPKFTGASAIGNSQIFDNGTSVLIGGLTQVGNIKFQVNGTARISDVLTLNSTISNGTNIFTLPNNTGTLALTSQLTSGTVTSVAALTLGTSGTDLSSTVATDTTTPVITLNVPTASAANRGALSSADWSTFNGKQAALNGTGFVKASGTTISYDNSTYVPTSGTGATGTWGISISGNAATASTVSATVTGTNATNLVYAAIADNDFFRIRVGGTASNAGFAEIATADDGNEPIFVRQYTGTFTSITRTATLLDSSGNTSFPGSTTIGGYLTVTGAGTSSSIYMSDTDEGQRELHCNSNRIGFLTQGGGWGSYCNDDGSWVSVGDVTAFSDARIKENIVTVDNALEKVLDLRGVYYNRIDTKDKSKKLGVIAQEVQQVVPEIVHEETDGLLGVSYGNMAGLFIEAFKEMNNKINTQAKEIAELKTLVNNLLNK